MMQKNRLPLTSCARTRIPQESKRNRPSCPSAQKSWRVLESRRVNFFNNIALHDLDDVSSRRYWRQIRPSFMIIFDRAVFVGEVHMLDRDYRLHLRDVHPVYVYDPARGDPKLPGPVTATEVFTPSKGDVEAELSHPAACSRRVSPPTHRGHRCPALRCCRRQVLPPEAVPASALAGPARRPRPPCFLRS